MPITSFGASPATFIFISKTCNITGCLHSRTGLYRFCTQIGQTGRTGSLAKINSNILIILS